MKVVIQRVNSASVIADGEPVAKMGSGLFLLLGVEADDEELDCELLVTKISKLRIFCDDNGKMNLSVMDLGLDVCVVSNFTLNANYSHGNRPDYLAGANPKWANYLYEYFITKVEETLGKCHHGKFGADMKCDISLDGPVTIVMHSEVLKNKKH